MLKSISLFVVLHCCFLQFDLNDSAWYHPANTIKYDDNDGEWEKKKLPENYECVEQHHLPQINDVMCGWDVSLILTLFISRVVAKHEGRCTPLRRRPPEKKTTHRFNPKQRAAFYADIIIHHTRAHKVFWFFRVFFLISCIHSNW